MERRKVLVLWHEGCTPASLQPVLTSIREEWAERDGGADIMLEHVDRLKSAEYSLSTFDYALLGSIPPTVYVHDSDLLEEVSRVLKTSAGISIKEPIVKDGCSSSSFRTFSQLSLSLRLAGFIEPLKVSSTPPSDEAGLIDELSKTEINVDNVLIAMVQAKKPSYQLGASAPINLGGTSNYTAPLRPGPSRNNESAKIWTLAANDMLDDDVDLMDSDTLLNEEDFLRPDPLSLKSSCGPSSGKRKACKNCSCGLADELLDPSKPAVKKTVTSSCGSCYLGDAFRCASCPYLGMPAFKPGQEIKLSDRQLNVDHSVPTAALL